MQISRPLISKTTAESTYPAKAEALLTDNAALTSAESYESNEVQVNAIFLNYVASGFEGLSEDDWTILETIALECPLADGEAVLCARALLPLITRIPVQTIFE